MDTRSCLCGAAYADHRSGASFDEACEAIRQAAGDRHEAGGGGFRSRGPVLWVMRCHKLMHWYLTHSQCGGDYARVDGDDLVDGYGRVLF